MNRLVVYTSIVNIILLFSCINLINCLYEDQVGKFDWKQSYVGELKFVEFDSVKRIIVGTEENVLASLQLKNGQIVWRHVLENGHKLDLLNLDKEVVTISGDGNMFYVRGWDINYGIMNFEWTVYVDKPFSKWLLNNDKLIHIVPVLNSHLEVTTYQYNTGHNNGATSKIAANWITNLNKCALAGSYWCCITGDSIDGDLIYMDVTRPQQVFKKRLGSLIGSTTGSIDIKSLHHKENALMLTRNNMRRKLVLGEEAQILPYGFDNDFISIQNGDDNLLVEYTKGKQLRTIHVENNTDDSINIEENTFVDIPLRPIAGICRGQACRYVLKGADNSISLMQNTGKILWKREEALSNILTVKFIELPVSEMDASIEHEFTLTGDVFGMLFRRISSQLRQITTFLSGQQMVSDERNLIRDDFGFHKVIIVVSKIGKLYAIDSLTGNIIWEKYLTNLRPFKQLDKEHFVLFEQRNARYHPLTGVCTLLGKQESGNGFVYTFDPITGKEEHSLQLDFIVKQSMLMHVEDSDHLKGIVLISNKDNAFFYPTHCSKGLKQNLYMYTIDPDGEGNLQGYAVAMGELKATRTWSINLDASTKIVALSMKPSVEKVHSQGRVLSDRSVLYKYVNPNLLAVATLSQDPMHKHVLSIYLIDGITGLVVYSVNHKRAKGPIKLVHSENWIVYSYVNEKFRRTEIASVELYEGHTQSNSTAFSSFALSQLPQAETQAYILPVNPQLMTTTLTERGITNKHLLLALSNGNVAELPWAIIEPRGTQLSAGPEEGFIPYVPELPIPPETYINYNQTLERINGIYVSPARLESTSLVLVYGLDIFYTRVAPSKTFDVLKEDFDHWLIVTVLSGLIVASYITKQLASRKALKQAWK